MGGRSISRSGGRIGQLQASRDKSQSQDELSSNYNQVVYPEYEKFLEKINKANSTDPESRLLSILQNMPNKTKFDYWQATEGQNLLLKDNQIKYPEFAVDRFTSQEHINEMSKDALNVLGFNAMGAFERNAYKSFDNLMVKMEDAIPIVKNKNIKKDNYWLSQNLEDEKVVKNLKFYANLNKLVEDFVPGTMDILLRYWLDNEAEPDEKFKFTQKLEDGQEDYSSLSPDRATEYEGYATPMPPVGSEQELQNWDPYTRRYLSEDEINTSETGHNKLKNEIVVGEDDGMNELLKVFKKGDKIRFVKLGDEHSEDKELSESASMMRNLLFGKNQSSIINQALEGAYRLSPTTFKENRDNVARHLDDVAIVFSFLPVVGGAEMQYNAKNKTIIVPITTAQRMLRALKTNDESTIKQIHESAYHELTHAIHHAVRGKERGRAIQDEYVADAFARMTLMAKQRDAEQKKANEDIPNNPLKDRVNTFEQAKETGYDPVIRELLQDKIFENTIPEELLEIDPVTRKPSIKNIPQADKERLLKNALENRQKAIENIQKTMTDVATNLVEISTFKDRLDTDEAERLEQYIKKSTAAHEIRKKQGGGKSRFEPALSSDDRLKLEELYGSDEADGQPAKETAMLDIHRILIGAKIPPSVISALQIISLRNSGVLVPLHHLSRAKRALTKESKRLQTVMTQDTKDLEMALRILYSIPKNQTEGA